MYLGPEANALLLEQALLHYAQRNYYEAMILYKKVLEECVHNRHDSTHAASFVVDPPGFTGRMIAANNYAICCVHNCCILDGIKVEEILSAPITNVYLIVFFSIIFLARNWRLSSSRTP